ncbi:hypothetical protein QTP70_031784 [Hemibagrus guttatus]|uniref:ribonuclease H n=1 Tax=Hemibagrus guttatus TaxID=175788 RepID=A0AAE0RFD8_9TELE|nr:hypothetical protein QTP70_031784 [Hemibagrus guttatus]
MAVYFDHRIDAPDSNGETTLITWHSAQPLLAVGSFNPASGGCVDIYLQQGERVELCHVERVCAPALLRWHPTKPVLAVGWETGETLLLTHPHGENTPLPNNTHTTCITLLEWSCSGARLVTGDQAGVLVVWKLDARGRLNGTHITKQTYNKPLTNCIFRPTPPTERKEDKETWRWNEEVQDSIQRKRLAKKKWDMDRTEENRQEYKELQHRVKREVSKAKQKAYDELYTRLDTREGEKDLYRLARQRDRDGKDVQQVRVIKDRDGRVLTSEESVQRRWKEYFEELMNEENEREKRVEGVNSVEQKVDKIRKDEVRKALKRMKSGKAVGPDDIPVEVWKCLGEAAVEFLANLFNRVLESERMPEEWRRSVLVPIFKNKGDVQSCSNYRGIKLMSHTMKVWERVVEARLRKVVEICEQQYGFMPRKSTTDAIFALRILMEKYRDGQRELHCVFVDLEKVYDRVPREELWYCMRKSGVAEKYVRVVQDMYERSRTVVRCTVGQTEEFKVEVGLHQGLALSPFLFAIVMDQLSEEVRQESPWTMMFADDIVICSESREQVEENLERWRFALERRGMKVSRSKTEYMCVNEREGSGTVRLQGEEVKKVQEFKYLGSTVQSNGECGKEVKKRVQAGWNGWRKVWGVLCDRKISVRIKGKVYRTVVRPAMLYGLETVSLRKRQESELEVAELKMLRDVAMLAKAAVSGDEEALDKFNWKKSGKSGGVWSPGSQEGLIIYVSSTDGCVYSVDEHGRSVHLLTVEGRVQKLCYLERRAVLAVVTDSLLLSQFSLDPEGGAQELSKVKLSGRGGQSLDMVWTENGLLITASGDQIIRLWDLKRDDNYVLSLDENLGFEKGELLNCVSFCAAKAVLAAGTSRGRVAMWQMVTLTNQKGDTKTQWRLQTPTELEGNITQLQWGSSLQLLAVCNSSTVLILSEHVMSSHYSQQGAAVQLSPTQLSLTCFTSNTHFTLRTDTHIRAVQVTKDTVTVWDGRCVTVYEKSGQSLRSIASFQCDSAALAAHEENIYTVEPNRVQVRTQQGTVKQLLVFTEAEGNPVMLSVCGSNLAVGTDTAHVRVFNLSRREAKPLCNAKNMAELIPDLGALKSVKCNANGSQLSILITQVNGRPAHRVYFYDVEMDTLSHFDFFIGRPLSGLSQSDDSQSAQHEEAELAGRYPVSQFWDESEPRLFVCETVLVNSEYHITHQAHAADKVDVSVVTFFMTQEHGLLLHDSQSRPATLQGLLALDTPYYYYTCKPGELDTTPLTPAAVPSSTHMVVRRALRDFVGLENCEKQTRDAMLNFSFYLTIGDMDEAFRAIKLIKSTMLHWGQIIT